jgi:hypothetical protein
VIDNVARHASGKASLDLTIAIPQRLDLTSGIGLICIDNSKPDDRTSTSLSVAADFKDRTINSLP